MKRISLFIICLFVAQHAMAQTPKAVLKSLADGDIVASTELYEKITDKTREKMPEMCYLAEAALLNMPNQMGANKLLGYEILSEHINEILNSINTERTFLGLDITLEQVVYAIGNRTGSQTLNTEAVACSRTGNISIDTGTDIYATIFIVVTDHKRYLLLMLDLVLLKPCCSPSIPGPSAPSSLPQWVPHLPDRNLRQEWTNPCPYHR